MEGRDDLQGLESSILPTLGGIAGHTDTLGAGPTDSQGAGPMDTLRARPTDTLGLDLWTPRELHP